MKRFYKNGSIGHKKKTKAEIEEFDKELNLFKSNSTQDYRNLNL